MGESLKEYYLAKDYYLAKAQKYPQLEQIITGKRKLTGTLDVILSNTKKPGRGFKNYMVMLEDLASTSLTKEDLPDDLKHFWKQIGILGAGTTTIGIGLGALLVALPPTAPIGLVLLGGFGLGGGLVAYMFRQDKKFLEKVKQKRKKLLEPLYELAGSIDENIARTFIHDHFMENPRSFEKTYKGLGPEEQFQVNDELYMLQESGLLDMDQPTLKKYLNSL